MNNKASLEAMVLTVLTDYPIAQSELCLQLHNKYGVDIKERQLREAFRNINQMFIDGKTNFMVVSGNAGSRITYDESDIHKFNNHRKKQALSLLYGVYRSEKQIGLNTNLSFDDYVKEGLKGAENG